MVFIIIFSYAFFVLPAHAFEQIDSFDVSIQVNADGSLDVTERIQYDFGADLHHGIIRHIPIFYRSKTGNNQIKISGIEARDEVGKAYQFEKSFSGNDVQIRVGDASYMVSGKKTYILTYKVLGAINFFKDHDELYWNVTGDQWTAPILLSSAEISLPHEVALDKIQLACYSGALGSKSACEYQELRTYTGFEDAVWARGAYFAQKSQLSQGAGLTVVVGFPKGIVKEPTSKEKAVAFFLANGIFALPFIVLVIFTYVWYTRGRDPMGHHVIVTQFDPPDQLSPTFVGALIDERVSRKDITAAIIDLAVRGHLIIRREEEKGYLFDKTDYVLERSSKPHDQLKNSFETTLMTHLFADGKTSVKLSELRNTFHKTYIELQKNVYKSLKSKKYFAHNPQLVRITYACVGAVVAILGFIMSSIALTWTLSFVFSGIIIMLFGIGMPARTALGVSAKEHILGFKRYLEVAEKERIAFHNAPEKNPALFERYLPYAIVLGVEHAWARQFEQIYGENPSWYQDSSATQVFRASVLMNALDDFHASASHAFAHAAASSAASGSSGLGGGGFSGGGFGGGGGSSW